MLFVSFVVKKIMKQSGIPSVFREIVDRPLNRRVEDARAGERDRGRGAGTGYPAQLRQALPHEPHHHPVAPPPEEGCTHEDLRGLPAAQDQLWHFLETGEVKSFCDGVCDPD